MLKAIGNYFKAPPILPVTDEKEVIDKKYKKYNFRELTFTNAK